MKKLKCFPDSFVSVENPLARLYTMRLLISSQLWKHINVEELEKMTEDFPIVEKLLHLHDSMLMEYLEKTRETHEESSSLLEKRELRRSERAYIGHKYLNTCNLNMRFQKMEKVIGDRNVDMMLKDYMDAYEGSMKDKAISTLLPATLAKNLSMLVDLYGLNSLEQKIFIFLVYLLNDNHLLTVANTLNYSYNPRKLLAELVARALQEKEDKVKNALSEDGTLFSNGLVRLRSSNGSDIDDRIKLLFGDLASHILIRAIDDSELREKFVKRADKSTLQLEDFKHIPEVEEQVVPLLRDAIRHRKVGCNILLYGASGTGKTELTRTLADHFHVNLFSVSNEDMDENRIDALRSSDMLLAKDNKSWLVVDECDDIFGSSGFHVKRNKPTEIFKESNPFFGTLPRVESDAG